MRRVALEEAFWFGELTTPRSFTAQHTPIKAEVLAGYARRLADFTEFRLPEMDRHGVDMQVLSLTLPSIQMQSDTQVAVSDARTANDYLALVVARHPAHFAGLAALPLQDPDQGAAELHRAVRELGMCGALVNDHTLGQYLDEPPYQVVWAALCELGVPLYLHPGAVPADAWPLSPLEMLEHGITRAGPLMIPQRPQMALEFLEVEYVTIQHYGVQVDTLRYNGV